MISWFTRMNRRQLFMVGIFLAGLYAAFFKIPEVTALSWNLVMMDMRYRGATPKDIEKAINSGENSLERVQGIEQLNADGGNGRARFYRARRCRFARAGGKPQSIPSTLSPQKLNRPAFIPESANWREVPHRGLGTFERPRPPQSCSPSSG